MGVERPVTRWFIQHDTITKEIAALETKLVQLQAEESTAQTKAEQEVVVEQLAIAHSHLRALGPCPKPMMG